MSENKKTIKLKYNDKETEVQAFDSYEELISFFQKNFSIDDDKKNMLSFFYYDEDGDPITFQNDSDYQIFLEEENLKEKIIEAEVRENNENNLLEQQDPMKSGTIFIKKVPEQHINLELDNDSSNNLNNENIIINKENINDNFIKEINEMNSLYNKTLENDLKEKEIQKMKKEMEEIIKKHKEELKKKRRRK